MRARWLAVLMLGFVVGAASILLADPGTDGSGASAASANTPIAIDPGTGSTSIASGVSGHVHNADEVSELQPDKPLDQTTRQTLAYQLTLARTLATKYPTVADATGAGYILAGGFSPGTGAHYITMRGGMSGPGAVDPLRPMSLIYDGTTPGSRIVGLMYYSFSRQQPEGFAGPNDHWHRHAAICVKYTARGIEVPLPADADVTQQQCSAVGGKYMRTTAWMVHAWVVPGWESPKGVFSHDNPDVVCADGTANTDKAGFCAGT